MTSVIRSNKGFSLVELMVVVAIIGILAAIAVPNFQRFSAKAKQSEAKANLAMVYSSEASFFGEWQSYTSDFLQVGFRPTGYLKYRITNAAFNGSTAANYAGPAYVAGNDVTSAATVCNGVAAGQTGCLEIASAATIAGCAAPVGGVPAMTVNTYLATASGTLVAAGVVDTWSITEANATVNNTNGLP